MSFSDITCGFTTGESEDWSSEFLIEESIHHKEKSSSRSKTNSPCLSVDDIDLHSSDFDDYENTKESFSSVFSIERNHDIDDFSEILRCARRTLSDHSEGDDCDWDEEFGVETEIEDAQLSRAKEFKHIVCDTIGGEDSSDSDTVTSKVETDTQLDSNLPTNSRIISKILEGSHDICIQNHSEPPVKLFSTNDDVAQSKMNAIEYKEWISNIIHCHMDKINNNIKLRTINWLQNIQNKNNETLNLFLIKSWYEMIHIHWIKRSPALGGLFKKFCSILDILINLFNKSSENPLDILSEEDKYSIFHYLLDILEIIVHVESSGRYNLGSKRNRFKIWLYPIRTSDSNHRNEKNTRIFTKMFKAMVILFPKEGLQLELALLERRVVIHHIIQHEQGRIREGIQSQLEPQHEHQPQPQPPSSTTRSPSSSKDMSSSSPSPSPSPSTICKHYLTLYQQIVKEMDRSTSTSTSIENLQVLAGIVISDIYLYINCINPLTLQHSALLQDIFNGVESVLVPLVEVTVPVVVVDNEEDREDKVVKIMSSQTENYYSMNNDVKTYEQDYLEVEDDVEESDDACTSSSDSDDLEDSIFNTFMTKSILRISTTNGNGANGNTSDELRKAEVDGDDGNAAAPSHLEEDKKNTSIPPSSSSPAMGLKPSMSSSSSSSSSCTMTNDSDRDRDRDKDRPLSNPTSQEFIFNNPMVNNSPSSENNEHNENKSNTSTFTPTSTSASTTSRQVISNSIGGRTSINFGIKKIKSYSNRFDENVKRIRDESSGKRQSQQLQQQLQHQVSQNEFKNESKKRFISPKIINDQILDVKIKLNFQNNQNNIESSFNLTKNNPTLTDLFKDFHIYNDHIIMSVFLTNVQEMHKMLCNIYQNLTSKSVSKARLAIILSMMIRTSSSSTSSSSSTEDSSLDSLDVRIESLCAEALFLLESVYKPSVHEISLPLLSHLGIFIHEQYSKILFQLHKFKYAVLDRIIYEAEQIICGQERNEIMSYKRTRASFIDKNLKYDDINEAKSSMLITIRSVEYLIYRAKCRLLQNDPEWSLRWLNIALACSFEGTLLNKGKIHYLLGKSYTILCLNCRCRFDGHVMSHDKIQKETDLASLAEEHFRISYTYFRVIDNIPYQIKTLNKLVHLHISRIFNEVVVGGKCSLFQSLQGKGDSVIITMERFARLALEMAGDIASPFLLLQALLQLSEIALITNQLDLCFNTWQEARIILIKIYFQPLSNLFQKSSSSLIDKMKLNDEINVCIEKLKHCHSIGLLLHLQNILSRILRIGFLLQQQHQDQQHHTHTNVINLLELSFIWNNLERVILQIKSFDSRENTNTSTSTTSTSRTPLDTRTSDNESSNVKPAFSYNNSNIRRILSQLIQVGNKKPNTSTSNSPKRFPERRASTSSSMLRSLSVSKQLTRAINPPTTRRKTRSINKKRMLSIFSKSQVQTELFGLIEFTLDRSTNTNSNINIDSNNNNKQNISVLTLDTVDIAISNASSSSTYVDELKSVSAQRLIQDMVSLIIPFEVVRRALSMEFKCHPSVLKGVQATRLIMAEFQYAAREALSSPTGSIAQAIRVRAGNGSGNGNGAESSSSSSASCVFVISCGKLVYGATTYEEAETMSIAAIAAAKAKSTKTRTRTRTTTSTSSSTSSSLPFSPKEKERATNATSASTTSISNNTNAHSPSSHTLNKFSIGIHHNSNTSNNNTDRRPSQVEEKHSDGKPNAINTNEEVAEEQQEEVVVVVEGGLGAVVDSNQFQKSMLMLKSQSKLQYTSGSKGISNLYKKNIAERKSSSTSSSSSSSSIQILNTLCTNHISRYCAFVDNMLLIISSPKSDNDSNNNDKSDWTIAMCTSRIKAISPKSLRLEQDPKKHINGHSHSDSHRSITNKYNHHPFSFDDFSSDVASGNGNGDEEKSSTSRSMLSPQWEYKNTIIYVPTLCGLSVPRPLIQKTSTISAAASLSTRRIDAILAQIPLLSPAKLEENSTVLSTGMSFLMGKLGAGQIILLMNALIMEESILCLVSVGNEEVLSTTIAVLLELMKPITWRNLCLSYVPISFSPILHRLIHRNNPFLIGSNFDILHYGIESDNGNGNSNVAGIRIGTGGNHMSHNPLSPKSVNTSKSTAIPITNRNKNNLKNFLFNKSSSSLSSSSLFSFSTVTVIDLEEGVIYPGERMKFAYRNMLLDSNNSSNSNNSSMQSLLSDGTSRTINSTSTGTNGSVASVSLQILVSILKAVPLFIMSPSPSLPQSTSSTNTNTTINTTVGNINASCYSTSNNKKYRERYAASTTTNNNNNDNQLSVLPPAPPATKRGMVHDNNNNDDNDNAVDNEDRELALLTSDVLFDTQGCLEFVRDD
eukprot:gene4745-9423_t